MVSQGLCLGICLGSLQIGSSQLYISGMQWRTQKELGGFEFSYKCSQTALQPKEGEQNLRNQLFRLP